MTGVNTDNDLQRLQAQLQQELAELDEIAEGAEAAAAPVTLDQTRMGRLSRMDAMQGQAMAQATNARRQTRATAVRAALLRLQCGEYGLCLKCGETIASGRLRVNPAAMLCIACAEQADQGNAS